MLQLSLPLHDVIALQSGGKTHIPMLALTGDVYEPLTDTTGRVLDPSGQCRFVTDDTVLIRNARFGHTLEASLVQIKPEPWNMAEIAGHDAPLFGGTLVEIWQSWTSYHDKKAYGWWNTSKDLFQPATQERGFRTFLRTRDPARYTAWVLVMTPIPSAEATASLTALIQSIR